MSPIPTFDQACAPPCEISDMYPAALYHRRLQSTAYPFLLCLLVDGPEKLLEY